MSETRPIVVGIDGSEGSTAALRYAAARAARTGRQLRLVHVAPAYLPVVATFPLADAYVPPALEGVGQAILDEAVDEARDLVPSDQVESKLFVDARVPALLAASNEAAELILGGDDSAMIERVTVGSLISAVAARAHVPVITVPSTWSASTDGPRVVAGIEDYENPSPEMLRVAFRVASERGASIEFVHVWDIPSGYARTVASILDLNGWHDTVRHNIETAAADARREFPEVQYSITVQHGHPATVLRDRSKGADLLLVVRHRHGLRHFGSTGRALLHTNTCPVAVVPIDYVASDEAPAAAAQQFVGSGRTSA